MILVMAKKLNRVELEHERAEDFLNRKECEVLERIDGIAQESIDKDEAPGKSVNLKANSILLNKIRPDKQSIEHTGKDGGPIEIEAVRSVISRKLARLAVKRGSGEIPSETEAGGNSGLTARLAILDEAESNPAFGQVGDLAGNGGEGLGEDQDGG